MCGNKLIKKMIKSLRSFTRMLKKWVQIDTDKKFNIFEIPQWRKEEKKNK